MAYRTLNFVDWDPCAQDLVLLYDNQRASLMNCVQKYNMNGAESHFGEPTQTQQLQWMDHGHLQQPELLPLTQQPQLQPQL